MLSSLAMCRCCGTSLGAGAGRYHCPGGSQVCVACADAGCPGCESRCVMTDTLRRGQPSRAQRLPAWAQASLPRASRNTA
jgi:hypothetical protein